MTGHDDDELHPSAHRPSTVTAPIDEWEQIRWASGTESPWLQSDVADLRTVVRTFCFLDLCRSTAYLERFGPIEANRVVGEFRTLVRTISSRRGVRVAKWLGDGAMLVGVSTGPVVATAAELVWRWRDDDLAVRGGVSVSHALLLDGDDYLARGANFAARICDAAEPGEVLCDLDCVRSIPSWIRSGQVRSVDARGMGTHGVVPVAVDTTHAPPTNRP